MKAFEAVMSFEAATYEQAARIIRTVAKMNTAIGMQVEELSELPQEEAGVSLFGADILEAIYSGDRKVTELMNRFGKSRGSIEYHLNQLESQGLVYRSGSAGELMEGRPGARKWYHVTPLGRARIAECGRR